MINKFFIKRFRTFFLIMIIPTIVIFVVFIVLFGIRYVSDFRVQGRNTISAVKTNFDVVIRNAVYQQSLMTSDHNMMLSLQKLIMGKGRYDEANDQFLEDFETMLRSIIYSHSYIDSIYIYLEGYNDFFSSAENGVVSFSDYYDTGWQKDYMSDTKQHSQWVVKREIARYSYAPPKGVLTVFQRMSSLNGVIVINIDENRLINILNSIVTDKNEYFFILDNNYSKILNIHKNAELEESVENEFFKQYLFDKKIEMSDLTDNWIVIGGRLYLLNSSKYPESQLYLVSLISFNALLEQFYKFSFYLILIFLGNCGIVFFLTYITTRRNFKQIEYMIQVFGNAEKGMITEPPHNRIMDEYDVIMNNIIHLFLKTTQMNSELAERQHQLEIAEQTALQLQINPHFLLNTMQTMDFEALKIIGEPSSINIIIHDLSDILKYALSNPLEPVSLRDELTYLKKYVNIQKYRFGEKFIVYYEIDDELFLLNEDIIRELVIAKQ